MTRSYDQFCGLARALDVVGDRWSLLVVRELLTGPRRYGELAAALPGIATNLLAGRLRDLTSAGVVQRRLGDGSGVSYELTAWGEQLREPVDALIRWSTPLMIAGPGTADVFDPRWLTIALRALLAGVRSPEPRSGLVRVAGTVLRIAVGSDGPVVDIAGLEGGPDVTGTPDLADAVGLAPELLLGLFAGELTVAAARERGAFDGDPAPLAAILDLRSAATPRLSVTVAPDTVPS